MKKLFLFSFLIPALSFGQGNRIVPNNGPISVVPVGSSITASNISGGTFSNVTLNATTITDGNVSGTLDGTFSGIAGGTNDAISSRILRRYNLRDFGALCDLKVANNCYFVAGSTTITNIDHSTQWGVFDIGKVVCAYEAGRSIPVLYGGTVWGVTNKTAFTTHIVGVGSDGYSITLSNAVINTATTNTTAYGSPVVYGTDDSAAFQSALNFVTNDYTAYSGGLDIFIPAPTLLARSLQDIGTDFIAYDDTLTNIANRHHNSQFYLPDFTTKGQTTITLRFSGPFASGSQQPSTFQSINAVGGVLWSVITPTNGGAIFSCENLTNPYFGSGSPVGYLHFNPVRIEMDHITWRTVPDPYMTAVDLRGSPNVGLKGVYIDCGYNIANENYSVYGHIWPTYTNSVGLRLAEGNSSGGSRLDGVTIQGFYNGLTPGEHVEASMISIFNAMNAVRFTGSGHFVTFDHLDCEQIGNIFYGDNYGMTFIANVTTELSPTSLYYSNGAACVNDINNQLAGKVTLHQYFPPNSVYLTNNGGSHVEIVRIANEKNTMQLTMKTYHSSGNGAGQLADLIEPDYYQTNLNVLKYGRYMSPANSGVGTYYAEKFTINNTGSGGTDTRFVDTNYDNVIPTDLRGGNPFGYAPVKMRDGISSKGVTVIGANSGSLSVGGSVINSFATFPDTAARNNLSWALGYVFNVASPITVTGLGRLYVSGNSQNHLIKLWNVTSSTLIASGTIDASSASDSSGFKYISVTPVVLNPGIQYGVAIDESNGGDVWKDNWTPTFQSIFINVTNAFNSTLGAMPTGQGGVGQSLDTPSLLFTNTAPIASYGLAHLYSGFAIPTNYISANFTPAAGMVKVVSSNNWLFTVTTQSTNPLVQINP